MRRIRVCLAGRHWRCGGIPAAAASAQHWVRGGHRPPHPRQSVRHPAGGLVRGSGGSLPAGGPAPSACGPRGPTPLSHRLLRGFPRAAHSGGDGALPAGSLRRSRPALRLLRRQRPHRQRRDGDRFCDRPGQSALLRQGASGGGSAVSSLGGQPASRCACLPHPAGGRDAQALSESSAAGARLLPSGAAGADLPGGVRRPCPRADAATSCWRWCSWLWPSTGCPPSPSAGRDLPFSSSQAPRWPSPSAWPLWRIGRIRPGSCSTRAAP